MDDPLPRLLDAWRIPGPCRVRAATEGANNRTFLIDSPAGLLVLRIYPPRTDPSRVAHEHSMLSALQGASLSFAIPQPLAAADGRTIVTVERTDDLAVLVAAISGGPPPAVDPYIAERAGAALGELDRALAQIAPPSRRVFALQDDLTVGPSILAVLRAPAEALLAALAVVQTDLYARLPWQTIHADFDPSNVLFDGERVSGVLDFEFAGWAPRAMDLAIALHGFAGLPQDAESYWALVGALAGGYRQQLQLTETEVAALPDLMRLREAISLTHWIALGAAEADLAARTGRFLRLNEQLTALGAKLIHRVATAESCLTNGRAC